MPTITETRALKDAVKYKIHAVNSVNGVGRSANNNVFYDTYAEAYDRCMQYMAKGEVQCGGFVIMKTCAIFRFNTPPISVYAVRDSGKIEGV
jgi:hypothetical protein